MSIIPVKPCEHPSCGCKVDDDQRYCSEACSRSEVDDTGKCTCGHSDCVIKDVLKRNDQDWGP
jgi:hypothetical protein